MTYWLDLFTGTTWEEFISSGSRITGFRERMRVAASNVRPGDIFICYLTGVKRWVGALEVVAPTDDNTRIWLQDDFPVRFEVRPLLALSPEHGIPMEHLEGRVRFYLGEDDRGGYKGFVRMSPNRFRSQEDAELIINLMRQAEVSPVARPVDERKLRRLPTYGVLRQKGKRKVATKVTVPERDELRANGLDTAAAANDDARAESKHTEIQHALLKLGADMGLKVWVARNDRGRTWRGKALGAMPSVLAELPTQFNEATTRTVELIDVLWLRGNSIVAAFEIEHSTSIYSGLLRMSDLLALQPNLDMKLYLVAPDERRDKVAQEIRRPTFSLRERPVPEVCGFISFSTLVQKVEGIRKLGLASSLKPDFLETTAEYFNGASG